MAPIFVNYFYFHNNKNTQVRTTELIYGNEAGRRMQIGINKVADAVACTLGPGGRNVAIQKVKGRPPHVTKDGVTVADSIAALKDPYEDIGAQLIKQAAQRTAAIAGDGTTTSTVLARAMFNNGFEMLESIESKSNAVELKREMDYATKYVVNMIKLQSKKISLNSEDLDRVAIVSTNNDVALGTLIANAMRIAGENGAVTVEPSLTPETTVAEIVGLTIDKGFIHERFINKPEYNRVELINPVILLYPKKISEIRDLLKVLQFCLNERRPLFIIAENVDSNALGALAMGTNQEKVQSCAIKLPHYGAQSLAMLEDIAIATGGTVINEDMGIELHNATPAHFGSAAKIIVTRESTVIINGKGTAENVSKRIEQLKNFVGSDLIKPNEVKVHNDRIAKLQGKSAIIYIGAHTDVERKEKVDRVDDALRATQAAIEEGVVAGCGNTLAYMSKLLEPNPLKPDLDTDGAKVIASALKAPMIAIMQNAGVAKEIIDHKLANIHYGLGIDFSKEDLKGYDDISLFENGILDPAKVVRAAVENANSVAGMMLTMGCMLSEQEESK